MGNNVEYWLSKRGDDYLVQQEVRRAAGNLSYSMQEHFLRAYVESLAAAKGGQLKILDFGCGFGRMLACLSGLNGVSLCGYDLSEAMVAPLKGRIMAGEIDADVRVADTIELAFPYESFDLIFTVSVLIHNSTESAHALMQGMLGKLAVGGQVVLIENPVSCVSMRTSDWHGGCWSHDIAGDVAQGNRIVIDSCSVPGHGVYIVERAEAGPDVLLKDASGNLHSITRAELEHVGLDQVVSSIRALEEAAMDGRTQEKDNGEAISRIRGMFSSRKDAGATEEFGPLELVKEVEGLKRRNGELEEVVRNSELEASRYQEVVTRLEQEAASAIAALRRRERIRASLSSEFRAELVSAPVSGPVVETCRGTAGDFEFDAFRDTRYANGDDRFAGVCHVFHQQWFGMRSAAGALPGAKLAVSADHAIGSGDVERIAEELNARNLTKVVVHGFSDTMAMLCRALAAASGVSIHLVWHGAPVMWVWEAERRLFFRAKELLDSGVVRRMHVMRHGNEGLLGARGWRRQLLNMPPRLAVGRKLQRRSSGLTVVSPSWNLIHKNVYTNLYAALLSPNVDKVWVLARDIEVPLEYRRRIEVLPTLDQAAMLETMRLADIVCNVSLVDCHPMVDLEALAARTPCLSGPLYLDTMEGHEYVRMTRVDNVLSMDAIRERIDAIAGIDQTVLMDAMADYHAGIVREAADRYLEFMGE